MKEHWNNLRQCERWWLSFQVYYTKIVNISGFKYLPTPNQIVYCDWDNIGPIYQDALFEHCMACHS